MWSGIWSCAQLPAVAPSITPEEAAPPPGGFAPLYYLRLGFKIVCWDDVSIRRASHDPKAAFYGAFFWAVSATIVLLFAMLPRIPANKQVPVPVQAFAILVGLGFALVLMGIITFIQYGLSHLIAKGFFGATGTLVPIMRPLLLAWGYVNALTLIPVVGLGVAGIA